MLQWLRSRNELSLTLAFKVVPCVRAIWILLMVLLILLLLWLRLRFVLDILLKCRLRSCLGRIILMSLKRLCLWIIFIILISGSLLLCLRVAL